MAIFVWRPRMVNFFKNKTPYPLLPWPRKFKPKTQTKIPESCPENHAEVGFREKSWANGSKNKKKQQCQQREPRDLNKQHTVERSHFAQHNHTSFQIRPREKIMDVRRVLNLPDFSPEMSPWIGINVVQRTLVFVWWGSFCSWCWKKWEVRGDCWEKWQSKQSVVRRFNRSCWIPE